MRHFYRNAKFSVRSLALLLAALLLAGCASSEGASEERKRLDGKPIYEKDEVDRAARLLTEGQMPRIRVSTTIMTATTPPPQTGQRRSRLRDGRVGFVVNTEGRPVRLRTLRSTGSDELDERLRRAVAKQRYVPGLLDDQTVPVRLSYDYDL